MEGQKFAKTKYMRFDPHPRIHEKSVDVWLLESPSFLTITNRADERALEHIAWEHIKNISHGTIKKEGVSSFLTHLSWAAGGFESSFHSGVIIDYWDEDYERSLSVFFKTGGRNASDQLIRALWGKRDHYIHSSGQRGDIRR